jgi:hypothetical protein
VLLWEEYRKSRNERALETLLAYNVQDTMNLETLLIYAFNRKLAELEGASFTAEYRASSTGTVANPFRADRAVVQRILRAYPGPRPFTR